MQEVPVVRKTKTERNRLEGTGVGTGLKEEETTEVKGLRVSEKLDDFQPKTGLMVKLSREHFE